MFPIQKHELAAGWRAALKGGLDISTVRRAAQQSGLEGCIKGRLHISVGLHNRAGSRAGHHGGPSGCTLVLGCTTQRAALKSGLHKKAGCKTERARGLHNRVGSRAALKGGLHIRAGCTKGRASGLQKRADSTYIHAGGL